MSSVLVVDDESILRDALCALLAGEPGLEALGAVEHGPRALEQVLASAPQVAIFDWPQAPRAGVEALAAICPHTRVLVLTGRREAEFVLAARRAGARGYLLKNDRREQLFAAIAALAAGQEYWSPSLQASAREGGVSTLTEREREVMRLIAAGRRTREIALALCLSHKTVEKHRASLMRKLDLKSAPAVAAYAIAHGWF